jgi:AGZA family xanthine/uracil permease-like MFS transporter
MLRDLAHVDWEDTTESVPAVITALMMPFTYSIANGIAFGFISYAGLKLLCGRAKEVPLMVWIIAAVFLFKFIYLGGG